MISSLQCSSLEGMVVNPLRPSIKEVLNKEIFQYIADKNNKDG